ncbi:bifunctional riboflavin kinase/FAD synthetase [Thalassolituus sp.]|uniref:bifunctional riboflavin kinase/FAD synthetase n=1 Tax=Thalassolituus sp. TaxID=2030822 RepID=UPI00351630B8
MRLIRGLHNLNASLPVEFDGCVATIGNFDGLHLGHRRILDSLQQASGEHKKPTLVMMFEPQPKEYFAPDLAPPRLAGFRDKYQDLRDAGIDYLLCLPFNESLRSMSAAQFIQTVLIDGIKVRHLIVGDDFRFGCDRSGDYEALKTAGEVSGFDVTDTPTHEIGDKRVSSTRVRKALANDNLTRAAELLGRPYQMSGRVAYGRQLGRTLDTPTANVLVKRSQLPMKGVYAVHIRIAETGEEHIGVANLGVKPTISGTPEPSLEVHVFGFDGNLYGQHLNVSFMHKIRDEMKFDGLDALKAAIDSDKQAARAYFASRSDSFRFDR